MVDHIVMFSGGVGSWMAARRVRDANPSARIILAFADVRMEDPDLYRFVEQAAGDVGGELVTIADGRTPWDVFFDVRLMGNTRADPCSRVLKREPLRRWLDAEHDPGSTVVYLGIDWTEAHRFERARHHWQPWDVRAPLCDPPYLMKPDMMDALAARGIDAPALYRAGFPHNNCGGFCVKAGVGQFVRLLRAYPERYREHEEHEQRFREHVGKDVSILRDRRGGTTKPLTLRKLRERVECGDQFDLFDVGGCGCFSG